MTSWRILTHGGAGSDPKHVDGTDEAARVAKTALANGNSPLEAACRAVVCLEDDPRFNAGTGSYRRADGETVEMDASCADSDGRFGAVACIRRVANPVDAALQVAASEHLLLAGEGADAFAHEQGLEDRAPRPRAPDEPSDAGLEDTVGCVVQRGEVFAAALSSGGTRGAPVGRVGDVPLPGCGLHAGPAGAVAATGDGEAIVDRLTALRAYERLERGQPPSAVTDAVLGAFPEEVSIGLILVSRKGAAASANRTMASSRLSGEDGP